jgi:asparagine synthase (glutamine-hydrolysing)
MCGICGIWGGDDSHERIDHMVAAMHHRGPDDSGTHCETGVALGMTRLAIIDLSPGGHQPMYTPDKNICIVYNGEIYNFQSERAILEAKGYTFRSQSDTEVLLQMYVHYGDDFLKRLRGMFALAIFDRPRQRLLLARDHFGIKPLLYTRVGNRLIFASELKALLASGLISREIDPVALRQLLTFGVVQQPLTLLRNVYALLPAHRMIVEGDNVRVERYWSLSTERTTPPHSYDEQVEELSQLLEESTRLQMISDVPLGAFLSGGIDSSILVALMARSAGKRLKTFSVGFENEGTAIDESSDAERTAEFLGTDHNMVLVTAQDVRNHIERIAWGLDQPSVDGTNSYFVSMAARQGVTVAISGTGGDELFAGYPWFIQTALAAEHDSRHPFKAAARSLLASALSQPLFDSLVLASAAGNATGNQIARYRMLGGMVNYYGRTQQIFGVRDVARALTPALHTPAQVGRSLFNDLRITDELPTAPPVERVSGLTIRGYLNNQLLRDIDAVSMSHSLEVRVPYIDPVIADYVLSLPQRTKLAEPAALKNTTNMTYRESGSKRILIDVGKRMLPKDFDAQPKRGFGMPFASWLRGSLHDVFMDTLSDETLRRRGLFDTAYVAGVRDEFARGEGIWARPWLLMMLELWQRQVLDKAG